MIPQNAPRKALKLAARVIFLKDGARDAVVRIGQMLQMAAAAAVSRMVPEEAIRES